MKTTPLRFLWFSLCVGLTFPFLKAQSNGPVGVHYQAVLRDSGQIIANEIRELRFSLLDGGGSAVYRELHNITTNGYGLFTAVLGEGTTTFGHWPQALADGASLLRTEIRTNSASSWVLLGDRSLQSVPYALQSRWADSLRGFEGRLLGELTDVSPAAPVDDYVLKWDAAQGQWVAKPDLIGTPGFTTFLKTR